jgi:hypothetical protein
LEFGIRTFGIFWLFVGLNERNSGLRLLLRFPFEVGWGMHYLRFNDGMKKYDCGCGDGVYEDESWILVVMMVSGISLWVPDFGRGSSPREIGPSLPILNLNSSKQRYPNNNIPHLYNCTTETFN